MSAAVLDGQVVGGAVGLRRWPAGLVDVASVRDLPAALLGPGRDYEPQVGDAWIVSVVRPSGVEVFLPRDWRGVARRERVRWRGRVADQSLWLWVLKELPGPRTVLVRQAEPVDADVELRIFRPPAVFTCPMCGGTSDAPKDLEQGYCVACHRFTGTPVDELARQWAARWELPVDDEEA